MVVKAMAMVSNLDSVTYLITLLIWIFFFLSV